MSAALPAPRPRADPGAAHPEARVARAGFADEVDINRPDTAGGVGMLPLNNVTSDRKGYRGPAENRVRQSSVLTYLAAARARPNLAVRGGALVNW